MDRVEVNRVVVGKQETLLHLEEVVMSKAVNLQLPAAWDLHQQPAMDRLVVGRVVVDKQEALPHLKDRKEAP
jgi:hypothetical protein